MGVNHSGLDVLGCRIVRRDADGRIVRVVCVCSDERSARKTLFAWSAVKDARMGLKEPSMFRGGTRRRMATATVPVRSGPGWAFRPEGVR
jgi:hypothetical protein